MLATTSGRAEADIAVDASRQPVTPVNSKAPAMTLQSTRVRASPQGRIMKAY
jgi:hypothetical protein